MCTYVYVLRALPAVERRLACSRASTTEQRHRSRDTHVCRACLDVAPSPGRWRERVSPAFRKRKRRHASPSGSRYIISGLGPGRYPGSPPAFLRISPTMAPRAKASSETVEPTRRSTRISAQPKVEAVKEAVKKAVTKASGKKRAADAEGTNDGDDAAPNVKKVRYSCSLCLYCTWLIKECGLAWFRFVSVEQG